MINQIYRCNNNMGSKSFDLKEKGKDKKFYTVVLLLL